MVERRDPMKICVAQTRSITGDIQRNIESHKKFVALANANGADIIIFPELSLTGYEPALAETLATTQEDRRFDIFQEISDAGPLTIGVGVPTKQATGICISLVLFQPHQPRQTYAKQYLHPDEEEFFVSGQNFTGLIGGQANIALAICYELSIPDHAEQAFQRGAQVYIASVAKFANNIDKATKRLSEIAHTYARPVLMSNCVGHADGDVCVGQTSMWNDRGVLVGQLDDTREGIIIFDTNTQEIIEKVYLLSSRHI